MYIFFPNFLSYCWLIKMTTTELKYPWLKVLLNILWVISRPINQNILHTIYIYNLSLFRFKRLASDYRNIGRNSSCTLRAWPKFSLWSCAQGASALRTGKTARSGFFLYPADLGSRLKLCHPRRLAEWQRATQSKRRTHLCLSAYNTAKKIMSLSTNCLLILIENGAYSLNQKL